MAQPEHDITEENQEHFKAELQGEALRDVYVANPNAVNEGVSQSIKLISKDTWEKIDKIFKAKQITDKGQGLFKAALEKERANFGLTAKGKPSKTTRVLKSLGSIGGRKAANVQHDRLKPKERYHNPDNLDFVAYARAFEAVYGEFVTEDGSSEVNTKFQIAVDAVAEKKIVGDDPFQSRRLLGIVQKRLAYAAIANPNLTARGKEKYKVNIDNILTEALEMPGPNKKPEHYEDQLKDAKALLVSLENAEEFFFGADAGKWEGLTVTATGIGKFLDPLKELKLGTEIESLEVANKGYDSALNKKGKTTTPEETMVTKMTTNAKNIREYKSAMGRTKEFMDNLTEFLTHYAAVSAKMGLLTPKDASDALASLKSIDKSDFKINDIITIWESVKGLPANVAGKTRDDFNTVVHEQKQEVKDFKGKFDISMKTPGKLTDHDIAKRIYSKLVDKQYPHLDSRERANIVRLMTIEDTESAKNFDDFTRWAQRGSAKVLDLMSKRRSRDFYQKVIQFRYADNDGNETQVFEGFKPEDFQDPEKIAAMLRNGELSMEQGFYLLAAFNHYDRSTKQGKKGLVRSSQGIAVEKALKELIAKELGVDDKLDDPDVIEIVNKALADNLDGKPNPPRRNYASMFNQYVSGYEKNKKKATKNRKRHFKLRARKMRARYRAGELSYDEFKADREDLLQEMRDEGLLSKHLSFGDGFMSYLIAKLNSKALTVPAHYARRAPLGILKFFGRSLGWVGHGLFDLSKKKDEHLKPYKILDITKEAIGRTTAEITNDSETNIHSVKIKRIEKQIEIAERKLLPKAIKTLNPPKFVIDQYRKDLIKAGKIIDNTKDELAKKREEKAEKDKAEKAEKDKAEKAEKDKAEKAEKKESEKPKAT